MKQRILLFVTIFIYFIFIFCIQKLAFMLMYSLAEGGFAFSDIFRVLYHGLPLDMSMSGYLTVIPALALIFSIRVAPKIIAKVLNVYFAIILSLVAVIAVVDLVVYPYWGFHFDSTVFFYLQKPKETFASASVLEIILGFSAVVVFSLIVYAGYVLIIRKQILRLSMPSSVWRTCLIMTILAGALFLPIRGGITVSTMNVGKVYFSDNMFLNHAAINPQFNLMSSFFKSDNWSSRYRFYDNTEAAAIFDALMKQPPADSIPRLLNTDRPNIVLFILESFSARAALDPVVAPNMCRFAKEGVLFDNFYANSFRTDRGLVSVLSGYPAQPTVAIMKYPQKTENLPAIPKTLKAAGYSNLSFYYGGDADFTNMRSYLVGACGIKDIVSDKNFPLNERMTKWGAPDKSLIDRLYKDLTTKEQKAPFAKTVLTLSSHEPFDVPARKLENPFLNAVSYTDECLGNFVERLKATPLWNDMLLVFIADHAMQSYPKGANNSDPERFEIPMIWLGGAVKEPRVVSDFGSQNDLAATLLSQLNINHSEFRFSTDMLNPDSRKFAFYSYVDGFCMSDSTGSVTYDNDRQMIIRQSGNSGQEKEAKAFFQNMYMDLEER